MNHPNDPNPSPASEREQPNSTEQDNRQSRHQNPGSESYEREWARDPFRPFDPRRKSAFLASFLSALPGLGQVYVGYYQAGFLNVVVVGSLLAILNSRAINEYQDFFPLLVIFLLFYWLHNIVDAGRRAALYNHAIAEGTTVDIPQGLKSPGINGSILGGAVLMIGGFGLLLHTKYDIPIDWIEEWWPLLPMLFGAYLLGLAIRDRMQKAT